MYLIGNHVYLDKEINLTLSPNISASNRKTKTSVNISCDGLVFLSN